MNPLIQLLEQGQSVWLDYIRRGMVMSGELRNLIHADGLRGVTSNPTIFEKAIGESADYDEALKQLLASRPGIRPEAIYELLSVEDIRMAADVLRPVYDETGGRDGYVSLEVSPQLAHDTARSIGEARRLWREVNRPNLMVKIPATREGIPAIESLLSEGINVNITLMFSLSHYEAVAKAFLRGTARAPNPRRIASVASVFVSRIDTAVDALLHKIGTQRALALQGKIAIANAKVIYGSFREIFDGPAFESLRKDGVHSQRVLWGSTGTKNPAYSDVMYVEELIGRDTVNTMPPHTLEAFRDHGRVRGATVEEGLEEAKSRLVELKSLGIDLEAVTDRLQEEGVASFTASLSKLMSTLDRKCLEVA